MFSRKKIHWKKRSDTKNKKQSGPWEFELCCSINECIVDRGEKTEEPLRKGVSFHSGKKDTLLHQNFINCNERKKNWSAIYVCFIDLIDYL